MPTWSNVVLQLPLDGTNGATSFPDQSNSNHTLTARGAAAITTSVAQFGGASLSVPGSGSAIDCPGHTDFNFSGAFTIEFWIKTVDLQGGLVDYFTSGHPTWEIYMDSGKVQFYGGAAGSTLVCQSTNSVNNNVVHHVAITRNASNHIDIWIDGIQRGGATNSTNYNFTSSFLSIGRQFAGSPNTATDLNGFIDMLRIVNGEAVYTANFTPPTSAFDTGSAFPVSLTPALFGTPTSIAAAPDSMLPVRFGTPARGLAAAQMHGLKPAKFGKPIGPNDRPRKARGMSPVRMGYPIGFHNR